MPLIVFFIIVLSLNNVDANITNVLQKAQGFMRHHLNLSGKIVPRTTLAAYERINTCPAFAVTTPWGSPYMIFDKLTSSESEQAQSNDNFFKGDDPEDPVKSSYREKIREQSSSEALTEDDASMQAEMEYEQTRQAYKSRTTALYFTDPEDAQHLVDEMKQMGGGMDKADIRVMSTSLGRAVRQASRMNHGLPTGQPVDELTGRLDGSTIRYKIVPSKRELFYAATRCLGKERVGFFGETSEEDAQEVILSPRELAESRSNAARAVTKSVQKKRGNAMSIVRKTWWHMRGQTGIPVFYADGMKRKVALTDKEEIPLFLSYEDLTTSWKKMKKSTPSAESIPETPPAVEVFNFMDVVCAMERKQWEKSFNFENALNSMNSNPIVQKLLPSRFVAAKNNLPNVGDDEIEKLVFIPSSRAIQFKENTTSNGNGKARLRPMR